MLHTEIGEQYGGRGLGGTLLAGLLDTARSEGVSVVTVCPFARQSVDRHPEHQDLRSD